MKFNLEGCVWCPPPRKNIFDWAVNYNSKFGHASVVPTT